VVDVLIRGGAIEAVGANLQPPAGTRVIEAAGQTLLPGLFDLHTHLWASGVPRMPADWGRSLASYLAAGVTTVDDFSAYGEMFAPMRKLLDSATLAAPHVNIAARLSTPGGHGTEAGWGDFMTLTASTAEEAHARMKTALSYKPDVIKIFTDGWRYGTAPNLSSMNLETLAAMVSDAHAAGLKVLTHTVTLGGAKIAAAAGVDVLAHGIGDAPADDELIHLLKSKRTFYVSTLAVYEPRTGGIAERARAMLPLSLEPAARSSAEPAPERRQRWQTLLANVNRLYAAGVPVACGTDAGMSGTYHGWATLHELELFVEAGLTPLEAIAAGTGVSARALGIKDRGTIEPGKAADLVLVDGRPDEIISDVE
jgi:imidazolonepropionase-like amidohydrolase